jgi:mannose/fructose/N-acetylgalactosamine-specific phosphotransferase system component IIB
MSIVLIRVDDRLIHGQVLLGWTRSLGVDHAIAADDKTAKDPMQTALMKMAAPTGLGISVLGVREAAERILAGAYDKSKVLLLVRGPQSLLALREAGLTFDAVNVGNVRSAPGRKKLTKEVFAGPEDIEAWKQLHEAGVSLTAQWLPDQSKRNLADLLD